MIPETNWKPSPADIDWQRQYLRILTDDATWAVPASQSVFKINKKQKTFQLAVGDENNETNKRIAAVFKILGYTEAAEEPPKNGNYGIQPSLN